MQTTRPGLRHRRHGVDTSGLAGCEPTMQDQLERKRHERFLVVHERAAGPSGQQFDRHHGQRRSR